LTEPGVPTRLSQPSAHHRGRTVGIVSILTVVVAAFGYFREAALAARFGLSTTMDAYFAAIFVPTIVYMVLIAGTLSPLFIPILLQADESGDRDKLSETFSVVTSFVLLFLIAIVSCAMITAHQWLGLLFPGFSAPTMAVSVRLIYIIFPSVLFVALAGLLTAVLNGFHKFALAAFAPALSSVAVVAAALLARGEKAIDIVGIATAVGFLLQFLLLVPATAYLGIRYRPLLRFKHPAITKLLRVGGPLLLYLVVANGSLFLERNLASRLATGAVSTLTYAMRLFVVPANFLAAPLAIVSYPQFAREAASEGHGDLRSQVSRMFRLVVFLFLPVTVWTIFNALPITRLLYERGQFQRGDSLITSRALMFYGIGILPNAIAVILLRCFYAVQDTVTPLVAEIINLVFYAIVAILLSRYFGVAGLAGARGLSFFLVTAILIFVLWRKKHLLTVGPAFLPFFLRTALACAAMTAVNGISLRLLQSWFDSGKTPLRLAIICVLVAISGSVFLGMARLLKLEEGTHIMATVRQLLPGAANPVSEDNVPVPAIRGESL
jgi:putative peptidoglycan lipid II flippase